MNELTKINIPAVIVDFQQWRIDYPEDAEELREYAKAFARKVEVLITRLDELESPEVWRVFDELGVVL